MTAAITIHFKKPELTAGCIDSLLADGWAPILVWDNSDDDGVSLRPLQDQYACDERLHFLCSTKNLGFGKGMNRAMAELPRHSQTGPVLLINNDAIVLPGMREALLAQLAKHSTMTLIAPRTTQHGREQGWLYYHPWFALVTQYPVPGSIPYLSGCCLLVQRPDNSQPLFDEDFFMYGEDVELSWRILRQGGRLILLNRSYVHHTGSASSGHASATYEQFLVRSHWLLAKKLASNAFSRLFMHVLRIPPLLVRACLRSWRYKSYHPLKALIFGIM